MKGETDMSNYAVFDGTRIINVLVADSKEIAEQASNQTCFDIEEIKYYLEKEIVNEDETISINTIEMIPGVGWFLENNFWYPPKPGENYKWDGYNWFLDDESNIESVVDVDGNTL